MVQKRTAIDDLQEAFGIASEEATRTYKILMGSGSKQGLETMTFCSLNVNVITTCTFPQRQFVLLCEKQFLELTAHS